MGLYTQLPSHIDEVDVVIAGGGTAACVVASRLADADPCLSILIIEGGSDNFNNPTIVNPLFLFLHLLPTSKTTMFYKGVPEQQLANRELVVPSGEILGGGSSINMLTYSRAQRSDFSSWQTPGWSADEMLPYLKKLETYHGEGTVGRHGDSGPVHISRGTYSAPRSEDAFIRQDTAHTYLHPRLQNGNYPNLHVLVESRVIRVLFDDDKRAVGIEFQPSANVGPDGIQSIRARQVIVPCGALGTPSVLERSGVGNEQILGRAGIDVVADVPGVGENYSDHQLVVYPYRSSLLPEETVDGLVAGRVDPTEIIRTQNPVLGWNAMDITCKLRPSEADVVGFGPQLLEKWNHDFRINPNKPMALMSLISTFPGDHGTISPGQYFAVSAFTVYPYSRGHIHISGSGLDDLDFKTGFFSDSDQVDIKKCAWAYKKQREIVRRMDVYRGELALGHPPFDANSKAACVELDGPLGTDIKDIEYTPEDDAVLEQWLRENVNTTWHSLGTCKMAPREVMGVVDANLSVYGVKGLKVADLSIPPLNVAVNTNNTAIAVGEKAADIFIWELGLAA
ncbi:alcohol oxidase-like protein [Xylaria arbuscula]|nr:alcohol oxidase-like protein [Xylaria arbuscula]